jgi:hypothetical protein
MVLFMQKVPYLSSTLAQQLQITLANVVELKLLEFAIQNVCMSVFIKHK